MNERIERIETSPGDTGRRLGGRFHEQLLAFW